MASLNAEEQQKKAGCFEVEVIQELESDKTNKSSSIGIRIIMEQSRPIRTKTVKEIRNRNQMRTWWQAAYIAMLIGAGSRHEQQCPPVSIPRLKIKPIIKKSNARTRLRIKYKTRQFDLE